MNTKKEYIAPELTVVSFKVETGFAGSGLLEMFQLDDLAFDESGMELWTWDEMDPDNNAFGSTGFDAWD